MSGPIVLALRLTLALALYGFMGWAFFLLWREIREQGNRLTARRIPGISLMIHSGDDPPALRYFSQPEVSLGRDPGCDIPLMDETVSTRHAQLTYHHGQWWLEDLASMNGTRLNSSPVTMPTVLASGDEFQCGQTRLTVNLSPDTLVPPTQRLERQE
jgi:hypothetical protein